MDIKTTHLHDGRQEGLRVEEMRDADAFRHLQTGSREINGKLNTRAQPKYQHKGRSCQCQVME